MMIFRRVPLVIVALLSFFLNAKAQNNLKVVGLSCEYMEAPLGIDATNPRLVWRMEDTSRSAAQIAYQIKVSTDSGSLLSEAPGIWTSEKINSDNQRATYNGKPLQPFTKYYWLIKIWNNKNQVATAVSSFETGMMQSSNWKGTWISDTRDVDLKPAPYFRKQFSINKKIKSARAYIAVAGLYELSLNGHRIGDHVLDPMYTRFDRRTLYVTYDVTQDLQEGKNTIGVLLGNGWYNHQSTAVWFFHKAPWRARPSFCLDLRITYENGQVETITSGDDWKTKLSPVILNSIYTAEHYDATKETSGWNESSYNDSAWKNAIPFSAPSEKIVAQVLHPIRQVEKILTKSVRKFSDTVYVFDLGRNISGVSSIKINGDAGTIIRLKHGERLYDNGRVDQSNIDVHYRPTDDKDPFQTDIYILKGGGEESFMPRFNYKGFQYVEVTSNRPIQLAKENLAGYFMHSDVPPVGKLASSSGLVNRIWWATNNSYLSNLFGYPTDCPQREKNGWTGDAQIAIETGLYNFDGITIYEKWLADHRDEQQPNGVLPSIVPSSGWGYEWGNGPDWTSTIAIIPWNIYMFYGDSKLLADCYDNIKRYVDCIDLNYPNGITKWGLGDWIPVKSKSPVELTSTAYYFTDATILANAAKLFNKEEDFKKYSVLAAKIKNEFNEKYLDRNTGLYGSGLQTELSVPLFWHLVPEEIIPKTAARLAERVRKDSVKLDVGLLGTKAILNALSENGYADLAYQLASREEFPSWGWWIKNGATTLYENWPIDSKSDLSMNHIMFGEIGAWFYKALGGIKPDMNQPGFKNILVQPFFVKGLDSFTVSHQSQYGIIKSSWKRVGKGIKYEIIVPPNCTASLRLNLEAKQTLLQDGKSQTISGNGYSTSLTSGKYTFEIK